MLRVAIAATAVVLAMFGSCRCDLSEPLFTVIRSEFADKIREQPSQVIYICPGESVRLGWVVQDWEKASIEPGVGSVTVPAPAPTPIEVKPTQDTHYVLTVAKGDCRTSKSVDVFVVTKGKTITVSPTLWSRAPFVWEAKILPFFYSPEIEATSGRMQAPQTQGDWGGNKVDIDGASHSFTLARAMNPFMPFGPPWWQLAGTWQISPQIQTEVSSAPPGTAPFELTLQCKDQ